MCWFLGKNLSNNDDNDDNDDNDEEMEVEIVEYEVVGPRTRMN